MKLLIRFIYFLSIALLLIHFLVLGGCQFPNTKDFFEQHDFSTGSALYLGQILGSNIFFIIGALLFLGALRFDLKSK
jgi:hypothetical protein